MQNVTVSRRYDGGAQILHWLIAVLILGMFTLGILFDDIPRATRQWWINLHTVTGLFLFGLVLFRLFYRVRHTPPQQPKGTSELIRKLGAASHHLLYFMMIVIPIIGFVAYVWHGRVFDFGLFQLNFGVVSNKGVYDPAEQIHKYLAFTLMGLVGLHILASLWHHFIQKDGLLFRMMPGGT